jgi:hypothetical protein
VDGVEGAFDVKDTAAGDMGITFGGAKVGVPKKGLNVANVSAAFQEVSSESVTETVE